MVNLSEFAALQEELSSNYKTLHQHPELGFQEFETSKFIQAKLAEYGFEEIENIAITGVVATLHGMKPGKTVMLRADMDALPLTEQSGVEFASIREGVMHACGHDAHVTMLLGAARYLSLHRDLIQGSVKFVFQPAEEGAMPEVMQQATAQGCSPLGGAASMIQKGALKGVDGCFALHVNSLMDKRRILICNKEAMASSDMLTVKIIGKGGHGSQPHNAIDTTPALAEILTAYHMLVPREVSANELCVVSIGTVNTPSSSWNIIPEEVVLTVSVRALNSAVREYVITRLEELACGIAQAYRCKLDFKRLTGYMPTINDENMVALAEQTGAALLGEGHVTLQKEPFLTSEDVGYYFNQVPGALIWMGVKNEADSTAVAIHNPEFKIDLTALPIGVALHVNNAIAFLNQ